MKQQQAAQEAMIDWLSDKHELGAAPARIESTGTFELHGLRYYLFRYKKSPLGKWLLGVCGGYKGNSLENCGHVFSEMQSYNEVTAVEKATEMIEMIRRYWGQLAEEELVRREELSETEWLPEEGTLLNAGQRRRIWELNEENQFPGILDQLDEGIRNGAYSSEALDNDLEAALWKAYSCVNLDLFGMAERCLKRVESKGAEDVLWCYRYSVALMHLCRYEESLRYARQATAIEPAYPWGWLQLARIAYQAGEVEEALEAVRRGLELVPEDYEFLTTQQEILEKRPFTEMLEHFVNPDADRERLQESEAEDASMTWVEDPGPGEAGSGDAFIGFVLLSTPTWDPGAFCQALEADWGISCPRAEETIAFDVGKSLVAVSLIPSPVPDGEAEGNAANNYLWPGAVNAAKSHGAHLVVAVLNKGETATEVGKLFVKVCSACVKQENALGVYASGTLFQPSFYLDAASVMKEDELPVLDWIYFGLYRTDKGTSGYTYGMGSFGKDEIEVLGSGHTPQELRDLLLDVACYVLSEDVTLREGETIGFTPTQKLLVTRSEGVNVEGDSLKIEY